MKKHVFQMAEKSSVFTVTYGNSEKESCPIRLFQPIPRCFPCRSTNSYRNWGQHHRAVGIPFQPRTAPKGGCVAACCHWDHRTVPAKSKNSPTCCMDWWVKMMVKDGKFFVCKSYLLANCTWKKSGGFKWAPPRIQCMVRPRYSCVSKSTGLSSASPELSMFQRKTVNSLSHMSTSYTDPIPSNQPGKLGHCSAAKACCTQGTSHDLHSPILKAQAKSRRLGSGSVSSWVSQVVLFVVPKANFVEKSPFWHMKTSARQTQAVHGIENRCHARIRS